MKKVLIAVSFVFAAVVSAHSQNNTFPSSGNVGIGTTSPATKLDVRGGYIRTSNDLSGSSNAFMEGSSGYAYFGSTSSNLKIAIGNSSSYDFVVIDPNGGRFAIGTAQPQAKLTVQQIGDGWNDGLRINRDGSNYLTLTEDVTDVRLKNWGSGGIRMFTSAGEMLHIKNNGNVGIGTTAPDSKLTVKGVIHAEEVKVDLNVPGPDYVFADEYPLRSLEDTKTYIDQNKHLPGIPSSDEMQQNGVNLLEMNMKLLEKVEELTLHLIEQNVKNVAQEQKLELLEKEIVRLRSEIR